MTSYMVELSVAGICAAHHCMNQPLALLEKVSCAKATFPQS